MVATKLILAEGSTTTLEVKNNLRRDGYLAYQADISLQMKQIALQENWVVLDNGQFFIYTFRQLGLVPQ